MVRDGWRAKQYLLLCESFHLHRPLECLKYDAASCLDCATQTLPYMGGELLFTVRGESFEGTVGRLELGRGGVGRLEHDSLRPRHDNGTS